MAKILLVDDSTFVRDGCAKLLKENGHEVVHANNGIQAIAAYKESTPDLVFMDITMPKMDGITAVGELVKIDPKAKIVMLSAVGQKDMVFQAIKNGAKYFIVKPFNPEKILESVTKYL